MPDPNAVSTPAAPLSTSAPPSANSSKPDTRPILTFPAPHDRVTVRAFRTTDAPALTHHANNRTIWLRMSNKWPSPYTLAEAEKFIASTLDEKDWVATGHFDIEQNEGVGEKVPTNWAICWDDEVIGSVGTNFMGDVRMRTAHFGYWLGEEYWRKGIMSVVGPAAADYCFEAFGRLMRLDGTVFDGNPGSCRVMEMSGFEYSYFERKGTWKDGKVVDCHVYGRPRAD